MLLEDGGGGNSNPYQITVNSVAGGEEQGMSYQQIMPLLHGLNPGDMTAAAASFRKLGDTLNQVAAKLASTGNQLGGENWSGAAAAKAMEKFQTLHDQAARLAAQAHTSANVMDWMGSEVMPQFKSIPTPTVMGEGGQIAAGAAAGSAVMPGVGTVLGGGAAALFGGNGQAKADQAARQYLASFNNAMAKANAQLPPSTAGPSATRGGVTNWNGPTGGGGTNSGTGTGTGSGYNGPGGHNGSGTAGTSPYTPPATGHANLAALSKGNGGPTGSLQGYTPPSGTGGGSPFGGNPAGGGVTAAGGGNPFNPVTMVPGGAGAGAGEGVPGDGVPGEGVPGEGVPGEGALGKGSGLPGEEGLAGEGALGKGGLPGEGGVPGETGLADGAAGDIAGSAGAGEAGGAAGAAGEAAGAEAGAESGMMPMGGMGGGGQQDKERQRQAWMAEDESIWGVPDTDIGPIIG